MPCSRKVKFWERWPTKTDRGGSVAASPRVPRSATAHEHPSRRPRPFLRMLLCEKGAGLLVADPLRNSGPPIRLRAPLKGAHINPPPHVHHGPGAFFSRRNEAPLSFFFFLCVCLAGALVFEWNDTPDLFVEVHTHAYIPIYIYIMDSNAHAQTLANEDSKQLSLYTYICRVFCEC